MGGLLTGALPLPQVEPLQIWVPIRGSIHLTMCDSVWWVLLSDWCATTTTGELTLLEGCYHYLEWRVESALMSVFPGERVYL